MLAVVAHRRQHILTVIDQLSEKAAR